MTPPGPLPSPTNVPLAVSCPRLMHSSATTLHFQWNLSLPVPSGGVAFNATVVPVDCDTCPVVSNVQTPPTLLGVPVLDIEVAGLTPGVTYTLSLTVATPASPYAVSLASGCGSTSGLPPRYRTSIGQVPSVVRNVTVTAAGSNWLGLSWRPPVDDGSAAVTTYSVAWAPVPAGTPYSEVPGVVARLKASYAACGAFDKVRTSSCCANVAQNSCSLTQHCICLLPCVTARRSWCLHWATSAYRCLACEPS